MTLGCNSFSRNFGFFSKVTKRLKRQSFVSHFYHKAEYRNMNRNLQIILGVCAFGWLTLCFGQVTQESFPEERGLIVTYKSWLSNEKSQIRHYQRYPGYEKDPRQLDEDGSVKEDEFVPQLDSANHLSDWRSVDVDFRLKTVYTYDYGQSAITMATGYRKDLDIQNMKFYDLHTALSKGEVKLAVDWLSHVIYWADPGFQWIVAAPGQSQHVGRDYFKIIAHYHLDHPIGLALDPTEGVLCWADNGKVPKIECSDLKGDNRRLLVSQYLKDLVAITADTVGKRIYWIDDMSESIVSVTYDGENGKTLVKIQYSNFYEMDIFRDVLYATDNYDGDIYILNKTTGKSLEIPLSIPFLDAYGVAVYGEESQPIKETDYCMAKNCDHFCLSEKYGATCVCSEGFYLDTSTGKCKEYVSGFHKAIVFANTTDICLVDIRAFVDSAFLPRCIFSVNKLKHTPVTVAPGRKKRQVPSAAANTVTTSSTAETTIKPTTPSTKAPTSAPTTKSTTQKQTTPPKPTTRTTTTTATTPTTSPVPPEDLIKHFDMDMSKRILFFATADNTIYRRPIDKPIEDAAKEVIVKASGNISGLAYDAEDPNNLYWSESDTGRVWVINTVTRSSTKVTRDDNTIEDASNIVVLLNKRKLAVIAGSVFRMSLRTISTDGEDIKVLVSGKRYIEAFTYDMQKEMFYYISSQRIYTVSVEGGDEGSFLLGVETNIYSLTLYQNFLTWSYKNNTGLALKVYDLSKRERIGPLIYGNTSVVDMKILDVKLQTPAHISPCAKDNGGCHQICVTKYQNNVMTPVCECRLGYTLVNGANCTTAVVEDDFVLVTDWTDEEILQISLTTHEVHVVPGVESALYMGVYFDRETKKVIFAEYYDSDIVSVNLNGTDKKVIGNTGNLGYAYRFDMDRTSGNLYFTGYLDTFIGLITPSGSVVVLIDDFGWDGLNDIVVHPKYGWMYYTVESWLSMNYIGRANMDGSAPERIIKVSEGYPDGLAIDYINDRLFWSDATFDTIQQCNLNGLDCITIVNRTGTGQPEEIRDLVTDGKYLYYSTYRKDYVVRVELTKPYATKIIGENYGLGKLDTMSFYSSKDSNIQPIFEGCRDSGGLGDCSSVCLPSSTRRTCACKSGVTLKSDGRTCSDIYQCPDVIYQTVTSVSGVQESVSVTMDPNCRRYIDDKCAYTCPINYEPVFTTALTCTKVGWDLESKSLCKEIQCPASIDNGKIKDTCSRQIGDKCDFDCNEGFVKTKEMAVCTKNGTFHIPHYAMCTQFLCDAKFENGIIDQSCSRMIGAQCKYTCDMFYSPTVKTAMAMCEASGWNPVKLCEESMCMDDSLPNGEVANDCSKKVGDTCTFKCKENYVKKTSLVFCKADRKWHPADSCKPYTCSDTIENGMIDQSCTRTIGSSCKYTCNKYYMPSVTLMQATCQADGWSPSSKSLCQDVKCPMEIPNGEIIGDCDSTIGKTCNFRCNEGFKQSELHPNITCKYNGKWFMENLCLVPKPEKFKLSEPGVVAGFVIIVAVVIVLIVAVACMVKRKGTSSNYASFDTNVHGGTISLGNPGYEISGDVQEY